MNRMRKVLVTSISDQNEKTGLVTYLDTLSACRDRFLERNIDLRVVPFRDRVSSMGASASPPPQASRLKSWMTRGATRSFLLFLASLGRKAAWVALRSVNHRDVDVFLFQDFYVAWCTSPLVHRRQRRILVLHSGTDPLRHLFLWFPKLKGTLYERLILGAFHRTLRQQDLIVTLSDATAASIVRDHGLPHVQCIYNACIGPRQERHRGGDERLGLVAVGSLQYVKGFDLLIAAMAALQPAVRQRLHVTIVGEGPARLELEALIQRHALQDCVRLAGQSADVSSFLRVADAFILSSRDEGLPLALIEAMQFGLPLVATRVGSVPELIDGSRNILVNPRANDLQRALELLAGGAVDLAGMSEDSIEIFEKKVSLDSFFEKYVRAIESVAEGRRL